MSEHLIDEYGECVEETTTEIPDDNTNTGNDDEDVIPVPTEPEPVTPVTNHRQVKKVVCVGIGITLLYLLFK